MRSELAQRLVDEANGPQPPERVANGPSAEKQQELHDLIESGKIDSGPSNKPDGPVVPAGVDLRPKYDGEEAWLLHKALSNGGHVDIRDLPELRRLLDSTS